MKTKILRMMMSHFSVCPVYLYKIYRTEKTFNRRTLKMKKILLIIAACLMYSETANADLYRISVSRLDSNLYKDNLSGVIIQTRFCFEICLFDDAVLKYEPYSYDNKLIFSNGSVCDVVAIR